jgi:hypothetical protein
MSLPLESTRGDDVTEVREGGGLTPRGTWSFLGFRARSYGIAGARGNCPSRMAAS